MDEISYTLIISGLTLLSNIILHLRLKHCSSMCCESDCFRPNGEPNTPKMTPASSKSRLINHIP